MLSHSRAATVTVTVLKEYQEMIKNTTSDLEEHLQDIDDKLRNLSLPGARTFNGDTVERQHNEGRRIEIRIRRRHAPRVYGPTQ